MPKPSESEQPKTHPLLHPKICSLWLANSQAHFQVPTLCCKDELSVLDGCLLWAFHVTVPPQGRQPLLEELETHLGASKMKALARSYIWWPGMDAEIDNLVKFCPMCQQSRPALALAPLHSWKVDFRAVEQTAPFHGPHVFVSCWCPF